MSTERPQSLAEELANSLTHGMGLLLSLAALPVLVLAALADGDPWRIAAATVYGASLVLLYTTSTLYHAVRQARTKAFFRRCDHAAIYLLIAGTYTPFSLVTLRGAWGWALFGTVWGLAVVGILKELILGRDRIPSVPLYIAMGWLAVIAAVPLFQQLPGWGLAWLLAGGLLYTAGIVFYANDERWRHAHGVWHLFVLGGTACHYFTVLYFVC